MTQFYPEIRLKIKQKNYLHESTIFFSLPFLSTFHSVAQQYFNRDNFCVVSWRMVSIFSWFFPFPHFCLFHSCSFMYQQTKPASFFTLNHFHYFFMYVYAHNIIRKCWNEIAWIVCEFYIVNNNNIVLFCNPLYKINHFHKQSSKSSLNFKLNLDNLIKFFLLFYFVFS